MSGKKFLFILSNDIKVMNGQISSSPEISGLTWDDRKTSPYSNKSLALLQIPHLKCIQMCESEWERLKRLKTNSPRKDTDLEISSIYMLCFITPSTPVKDLMQGHAINGENLDQDNKC